MPHQSMWTNCTLNKCGWHTGIFLKIISNFKPEIEKIIILDNILTFQARPTAAAALLASFRGRLLLFALTHSKLDYLKIYQLSLWLQTVWLLKLKIFVFLQPSSCVDVTQPPGCWCVCPPMSALLGPHQFSAARPYFSPNCAKAATVQLRVTRL